MKRLIPVIHFIDEYQMLNNIELCLACGINQVFLISHRDSSTVLLKNAMVAKERYPNLWIGVNFLDLTPSNVLKMDLPFNALWIDETLSLADIVDQKFKGEVFSGLNFKYQPQFKGLELKRACELIKQTSNVACTSGPGTGKEANPLIIKALKDSLGDFTLALASGVSISNVSSYLPYVDVFMVASSITDRNEFLIKDLLIELRDKIYT